MVLPAAYAFLFEFGSSFATPSPTISSYMDLTIRLIVLLGLVFELPILIMGLARLRVVHWRKLLGWWRIAIIGS
ncbi:MAG: twin-arginine translocase subunit TatC, partial [Euryarchaeota archaeon]|nr:twin-arginine translocase subunit TatC [Euryarchaeota archaeon]